MNPGGRLVSRGPSRAHSSLAAALFASGVCCASSDGWSGIVPLVPKEGDVAAEEGGTSRGLAFLGELDLSDDAPEGLSGVAWLGGGAFAFAEDSGGRVHFADLELDRVTGIPTGCVFRAAATVRGAVDLEGIAFHGATGALWVSDETGPSIFRVATGSDPEKWGADFERPPEREALPPSLSRCLPNRALEALTFDPASGTLYTASETGVEGEAPGFSRLVSIPPRRPSTETAGRFGEKAIVREWLVPLEPATGAALAMLPAPFTGLCGLAALPDGRLLALERTFGYEFAPGPDGEPVQSLCRFAVSLLDPNGGTDPGGPPVLEKRVLWRALAGNANYEGICLGPELPDGGRLVVLVSDGDVSRRRGLEMRWKKSLLFFRLCQSPSF